MDKFINQKHEGYLSNRLIIKANLFDGGTLCSVCGHYTQHKGFENLCVDCKERQEKRFNNPQDDANFNYRPQDEAIENAWI